MVGNLVTAFFIATSISVEAEPDKVPEYAQYPMAWIVSWTITAEPYILYQKQKNLTDSHWVFRGA